MAQNTAAWLDGKESKLRVAEAEMPKPGEDEVLIKNHAVAVNPVDCECGYISKPALYSC